MPMRVSYMGTKRSIAAQVAAAINAGPPGPLLDLFCGICAVGSAVAPSRQIWCNDIQMFASTVATFFFTSPILPTRVNEAASKARAAYLENNWALENRFSSVLREENDALQSGDLERTKLLEGRMPNVASSESLENERAHLSEKPGTVPYRLFTITFSGSYLGLSQCIQIDSIRYAIDSVRDSGRFCEHQHRWMCLALCQAASKVSTTTGHFAQFMRVNERNLRRFSAQRRRSVWHEWLRAIFELCPIGTEPWRSRNRAFRADANQLLKMLHEQSVRPAVIYADPPYTGDQYSRYYHLYESLLLYDYPSSEATGRYRPDRYSSRYSKKTQVKEALDDLIEACARLGSRLVLSYPRRGLLPNSYAAINSLLQKHFGSSCSVVEVGHYHSSLGGSKGQEKQRVKELIFMAG